MKNSFVSIQWSEIALVGSIVLFYSGANVWLAGTFLGLSMLGLFFRYAIEQQEQKARSESLTKVIKDISNAVSQEGSQLRSNQDISDIYSKLFNFGDFSNKKTPH